MFSFLLVTAYCCLLVSTTLLVTEFSFLFSLIFYFLLALIVLLAIVFNFLLVFLFIFDYAIESIDDFQSLLNHLVGPKPFKSFYLYKAS